VKKFGTFSPRDYILLRPKKKLGVLIWELPQKRGRINGLKLGGMVNPNFGVKKNFGGVIPWFFGRQISWKKGVECNHHEVRRIRVELGTQIISQEPFKG